MTTLTNAHAAGLSETAALDAHLASLLCRLGGITDPAVAITLRRLSAATAAGHSCIELSDGHAECETAPPDAQALLQAGIVGRPGDPAPLILDHHDRLYLHRYWSYEQRLAANLRARAAVTHENIDIARLRSALCSFFPDPLDHWQRVAAAIAMLKGLCILSGGPGTGKTTTVVRVLALSAQYHHSALPLRMALAAPTGKAAARMQEAVRQARAQLAVNDAIKALIPESAQTLHRLLGGRADSTRFAHDREHPLALDLLVVDEVSMVDLALMTRLVEALPPQARLILVGDRDQLASVEPGAVLDSLCADRNAYTPQFVSRLGAAVDGELPLEPGPASSLRDTTVLLDRSRRFGVDSGIARLARAVQAGQADAAVDTLRAGGDVVWREDPPDASALRRTLHAPLRRFADAVRGGDIAEAFASLEAFRVLTAVRQGPAGVQRINEVLERLLKEELSAGGHRPWFAGKAVMVNRNHPGLSLFNGDIGVTVASGEDQGLRVVFRSADNATRALLPARLPAHEPAYALTVHKSQGSEFDEVLVVLPRADSPVLTRELLYTAITRARRRVEIWASEAAIRASIGRRTQRGSGLREACWATAGAVAPM